MRKHFKKSALSISKQITLLNGRGLIVNSKEKATHCLSTVSFYRLSSYFRPFEITGNPDHNFKSNTTFEEIWDLYVFDRELRLLVMDALERIEIALRTAMSNVMAEQYGILWYLETEPFKSNWSTNNSSPAQSFRNEVKSICNNKHLNDDIKFYYKKYSWPEHPPSWIIFECLSFGKCTSLFRYIRHYKDRLAISKVFNLHPNILESALEPLRYTRNLCAHHARLWDRWFVYKPRHLKELEKAECKTGTLKEQLCLIHILHKTISPHSAWRQKISNLFKKYPDVPVELMGFHKDWEKDPFWEV